MTSSERRPDLSRVLGAILNERAARVPARVELVWTGGEAKTAYARPTASVVRELFEQAEHHVLIAGYSFDHGAMSRWPSGAGPASQGGKSATQRSSTASQTRSFCGFCADS